MARLFTEEEEKAQQKKVAAARLRGEKRVGQIKKVQDTLRTQRNAQLKADLKEIQVKEAERAPVEAFLTEQKVESLTADQRKTEAAQRLSAGTTSRGRSQVETQPVTTGAEGTTVKDASAQPDTTSKALVAGSQAVSGLLGAGGQRQGVGETSTGAAVGTGAVTGLASGAAVGSLAGPVGTVVGAAVGAVVGGVTGALKASSARKRARRQLQNRKLRQIAAIEGEKEQRIQNAMAGMASRMSQALRVPTVRF
jgi:hypothetical protein